MKSSNTLQEHKLLVCHNTGPLTADDCYDDDLIVSSVYPCVHHHYQYSICSGCCRSVAPDVSAISSLSRCVCLSAAIPHVVLLLCATRDTIETRGRGWPQRSKYAVVCPLKLNIVLKGTDDTVVQIG